MDKRVSSIAAAFEGVADGAVVLIGGFGAVGQPNALIDALAEYGVKDLTVVANNAGWGRETGIPRLLGMRRVRKMICSFPKGSELMEELYRDHRIELELVPQGTLAERIRAAGFGLGAVVTPTGVGTVVADGKRSIEIEGQTFLVELPLKADFALVNAKRADSRGNLEYSLTARNFNPLMALVAEQVIAEAETVVPVGGIAPDMVITPHVVVDTLVAKETCHG